LYSEKIVFVPNTTDDATGTLQCSGYLRGVQLSANNLVYVPGLGDFQVSKIEAPPDPFRMLDKEYVIEF
jgi:pre-rRNA-processing protein TSR1